MASPRPRPASASVPGSWWANVPVRHRDATYIGADGYTDGSPAVRCRGIFINDEAPALSGWARERFGRGGGSGFNSQVYARVFALRLRANSRWPAMWGEVVAEDDPRPKPAVTPAGSCRNRIGTDSATHFYGVTSVISHDEGALTAHPCIRLFSSWKAQVCAASPNLYRGQVRDISA